MKKPIVAFVLSLVAGVALAQSIQQLDIDVSTKVRALTGGLLIGPRSLITSNDRINANKITRSLVADIDYDFASSTIVCTNTPTTPLPGAQVGDPCFVGIGPRDGGTQIVTANSVFSCFVDAADTVKLRHCAVGTAADPVDAGYQVRVFSSR